MTVTLKMGNGDCYTWQFPYANDINKLVAALALNMPDFATIEISINTLGPNLKEYFDAP